MGNALQTPTLYELLGVRSHVPLSQVYRGATLFTTVEPAAFVTMMAKFATGIVLGAEVKQELYADIDQESVTKLIAALKEHGVPPCRLSIFRVMIFSRMRLRNRGSRRTLSLCPYR